MAEKLRSCTYNCNGFSANVATLRLFDYPHMYSCANIFSAKTYSL